MAAPPGDSIKEAVDVDIKQQWSQDRSLGDKTMHDKPQLVPVWSVTSMIHVIVYQKHILKKMLIYRIFMQFISIFIDIVNVKTSFESGK